MTYSLSDWVVPKHLPNNIFVFRVINWAWYGCGQLCHLGHRHWNSAMSTEDLVFDCGADWHGVKDIIYFSPNLQIKKNINRLE